MPVFGLSILKIKSHNKSSFVLKICIGTYLQYIHRSLLSNIIKRITYHIIILQGIPRTTGYSGLHYLLSIDLPMRYENFTVTVQPLYLSYCIHLTIYCVERSFLISFDAVRWDYLRMLSRDFYFLTLDRDVLTISIKLEPTSLEEY